MTRQAVNAKKAPLRFYSELYVEKPPSAVWAFFIDTAKWNCWSPICRECRLIERDGLEAGAVLEMRVKVMRIPLTIRAKIFEADKPSAIGWKGEAFGIRATHTYRFLAQGAGTLMTNEELIYGARFPFNHLITGWYKASRLSSGSLEGIKRALESIYEQD
jgi:ligand-binding SRPBCC domain-containing protein